MKTKKQRTTAQSGADFAKSVLRAIAQKQQQDMPMLPNAHHPGARCSCESCLVEQRVGARMKRKQTEPETRVGICCGDACRAKDEARGTWEYALLFNVQGLSRYRCSDCYVAETGHRHYSDPAKCCRTYCTGAPCLVPDNCGQLRR